MGPKTHRGWVKLHRKFLDWEWYQSPEAKAVFIDCLLRAATTPKTERGIRLQRGQLITTIAELAERNGLSVQQTKTQTKRLKSTNEITIKTTNKFTIITVCNYESYQLSLADSQQTNQQTNQQTKNEETTNEVTNANIVLEDNNEKIKEDNNNYTLTTIQNRGVVGGKEADPWFAALSEYINNAPSAQRVKNMPYQLTPEGFSWLRRRFPLVSLEDFKSIINQMGNYAKLTNKMSVVQTMDTFLSRSTFCHPQEGAIGLRERVKRTIKVGDLIPQKHEKYSGD